MANELLTPQEWVSAVRARGVMLTVVKNRIRLTPPSAYKELTDAELLTLRHHRDEIKELVKATEHENVMPAPAPIAATATAPPSVPCPYCRRTPCVGPRHLAYRSLHYDDPQEVARRDAEATAEMNESLRRRARGLPMIQW